MASESIDLGGGPPIARSDDPVTSAIAAELIEASLVNRRRKVLELLVRRRGQWIPGHEFTTPDVGGSEGLRRRREVEARLAKHGLVIEKKPAGAGKTSWLYRLSPDGPAITF